MVNLTAALLFMKQHRCSFKSTNGFTCVHTRLAGGTAEVVTIAVELLL
jgi:hypothetical protein